MNTMTPRQRLFHALRGEPTDRTSVWLLFPHHPTGYYVDVRRHPEYRRVVDSAARQGVITLNRRNLHVPLHAAEVVHAEEDAGAGRSRRHVVRLGDSRIHSVEPGADGTPGKKLLASAEDLEVFCSLPLERDEESIAAALGGQLDAYRREKAEFAPELGAMMLDLGSPADAIYHAADLEEFAIWSLTHSDLIVAWLDRRMRQLEAVYRFCLERELADVYFLVGSELAAPPLVGHDTFRRWVVPYETKLINLVHSYGKHVIQHFHGQIKELLPDFVSMGADGLHTIEAPPTGNCTLSEAYGVTGVSITLIGNVQYDVFRSATPAELRRHVHETLDEVAGRRFILSPTAGPFDDRPTQRLIENYLAFIEAAVQYACAPA